MILMVVIGLDVDRDVEAKLVNMYVNISEGDMGGEMVRVNHNWIATVETLEEEEKGIIAESTTGKYHQ